MIGKIKTTRKQIQNSFARVFQCGYCELAEITTKSPLLYNSGIYGWNYDVYVFGNIAVTTGYRGMFGKNIPHELLQELHAEKKKAANELMWTDSDKYNRICEDIENKLVSWLRTN